MSKKGPVRPTDGELEILRVLWRRGPSTVRAVHKVLSGHKQTSCNTTLKLMQIMNDKGIVVRDKSERPQIYRAVLPEDQMQQRLVSDLLHRAFGGSARKLLTALTAANISEKELVQIGKLLDNLGEE